MRILFIILAFFMTDPVSAKPRRIVSINLCTDQLAMLLADRNRIASVSYLATKRDASVMYKEASGFPQNHGLAEEILLKKPDLVLAGAFTSRPTVFLLKELGFKLVEIPVASSIEDIRFNIRTVADAIGETRRGNQLIDAFDQRLAAASVSFTQPRPIAAYYRENGFTSGAHSLGGAILEAAGFINLAAQLGISGTGHLALEVLISHRPDFIVRHQPRHPDHSVAIGTFQHPAFRTFAADRSVVRIADPLWACGTPFVIEAIEHLAASRQQWQSPETSGGQVQ